MNNTYWRLVSRYKDDSWAVDQTFAIYSEKPTVRDVEADHGIMFDFVDIDFKKLIDTGYVEFVHNDHELSLTLDEDQFSCVNRTAPTIYWYLSRISTKDEDAYEDVFTVFNMEEPTQKGVLKSILHKNEIYSPSTDKELYYSNIAKFLIESEKSICDNEYEYKLTKHQYPVASND